MKRLVSIALVLCLAITLCGCGNSSTATTAGSSSGDTAAQTADSSSAGSKAGGSSPRPAADGPEAAVWDFLEAVRTGNDQKASQMLTPLARAKVSETNMVLAPPGTDTARFVIGNVERLADDGARVTVDWTDLDYNGKPRTDQTIWMVRKEAEGWRIAGMAVPVFEGEPMVLMNFEDPADMLQKQKMVHDEIQRRAKAAESGNAQGQTPAAEGPAMTANAPAGPQSPGHPTSAEAASQNAAAPPAGQSPAIAPSEMTSPQVATPENPVRR